MVKFLAILAATIILCNCSYRTQVENGKRVFVGSPHRLFKESDTNFYEILDTNALYYKAQYQYGAYLKFESGGWLIESSWLKTDSFQVSLNSVKRGRYCVRKNKIIIESFGPADSYFVNNRFRYMYRGVIRGDSLILKSGNGQPELFVKSNRYYFEDGVLKDKNGK